MSDPAYNPPPLHFQLALRLQNGGHTCGTLRYPYKYKKVGDLVLAQLTMVTVELEEVESHLKKESSEVMV